ncbi:MAG: hypothetical protein AABZ30_13570 [Myxococcota bacterium]
MRHHHAAPAVFWLGCACGDAGFTDEGEAEAESEREPDGGALLAGPDMEGIDPITFDAGPCVATDVVAENVVLPVDIIWIVDSSGSMDFENDVVQNNLNAFSTAIAGSGVDYRVVLIGSKESMCVPPPLGGAGCSDGPSFMSSWSPTTTAT